MNWMIYGANGYTGQLIARQAAASAQTPVLAGRSRHKIEALAKELGLEYACFDLESDFSSKLENIQLVLHCAGPFSKTAEPMMKACLQQSCHYLDISGEIQVFERAQELSDTARRKNIVLCPGVGFDVIPTDCIAAKLKHLMPQATELALGFDSRSGFSPGTAKTSVEGLALGGRVRKDGLIKAVPLAYKTRRIDFGDSTKLAVTIPWGDISTAYASTGIKNIEVYIPASPKAVKRMRLLRWLKPILGFSLVQKFLKYKVGQMKGPSKDQREAAKTWVWGEVKDSQGNSLQACIEVANGYSLTIDGSLMMVAHLLNNSVEGGFYTPSQLLGYSCVEQLPGSGKFLIRD